MGALTTGVLVFDECYPGFGLKVMSLLSSLVSVILMFLAFYFIYGLYKRKPHVTILFMAALLAMILICILEATCWFMTPPRNLTKCTPTYAVGIGYLFKGVVVSVYCLLIVNSYRVLIERGPVVPSQSDLPTPSAMVEEIRDDIREIKK